MGLVFLGLRQIANTISPHLTEAQEDDHSLKVGAD